MRGQGPVRPTGAKMGKITPHSNKLTNINPGNVDPSPSPSMKASSSTHNYMRQKHLNPSNLHGAMIKTHKSYTNKAPIHFGKKILARG
jgi:hypothetical protein